MEKRKIIHIGNEQELVEKKIRERLFVTSLIAGMCGLFPKRPHNPPDASDRVINPPTLNSTVLFLKKRAEDKRQRKNAKRLNQGGM